MLDHYGARVRSQRLGTAGASTATAGASLSAVGATSDALEEGRNVFTGLSVTRTPASSVVLAFDAVVLLDGAATAGAGGQAQLASASLNLTLRSCVAGEVMSDDGASCTRCAEGTFAWDPSWAECRECLDHASCPGGGEVVTDAGNWRGGQKSKVGLEIEVEKI